MTTDKELLELAAKAIGMKLRYNMLGGLDARQNWNPLEDDGDAFRLATQLGMLIDTTAQDNLTFTNIPNSIVEVFEVHGDDKYAATRRAIVRAAACIGSD